MTEPPLQLTESHTGAQPSSGIEMRAVRRSFGDVVAVDHLDLHAPAGLVTALVGPNGAGKTTAMLVLATLLVPDSGEVRVAGFDPVAEPAQVRARMGWMPDTFGSYDTLTVTEVLRFVAAAYRLPKSAIAQRCQDLLALTHLEEFAARPVHVLSKGQKQRLGLARALVHDPSVLILDEPAAGLDPRSRIELRATLRSLAAQGRSVLVSSHILGELEEMADRVVFVDRGRTVDQRDISALGDRVAQPWLLHSLDDARLAEALTSRGLTVDLAGESGVRVLLNSEEQVAALVADLVRAGIPLVSCGPAGSALEAAYLAMTASSEERR